MTYQILVRFEREESDDIGVIGADQPTPEQYAKQLAVELQEAYDELAIAGQFQVVEVIIDGTRYVYDPTTRLFHQVEPFFS